MDVVTSSTGLTAQKVKPDVHCSIVNIPLDYLDRVFLLYLLLLWEWYVTPLKLL